MKRDLTSQFGHWMFGLGLIFGAGCVSLFPFTWIALVSLGVGLSVGALYVAVSG